MGPEKRAVRGAATATARGNEPAPETQKIVAKMEAENNDLSSPEKQRKIMNPETVTVSIGGVPTELHPLSARRKISLVGLIHNVSVSIFQDEGKTGNTLAVAMRLVGVLAEKYLERFTPFVAAATKKPGDLNDQQIQALSLEICENLKYAEMTPLINALCTQNGVWDEMRAMAPEKKA